MCRGTPQAVKDNIGSNTPSSIGNGVIVILSLQTKLLGKHGNGEQL